MKNITSIIACLLITCCLSFAADRTYPVSEVNFGAFNTTYNLNITGFASGSALNLYAPNGAENEDWRINYISDGVYEIENSTTGSFITAGANNVAQIATQVNNTTQRWQIVGVTKDFLGAFLYYKIINVGNGKALTFSGTSFLLSDYTGANNQLWRLDLDGLEGFGALCKVNEGLKASTIGGLLGQTVFVSTLSDLRAALANAKPLTIVLTANLDAINEGSDMRIDNYKTLIGSFAANTFTDARMVTNYYGWAYPPANPGPSSNTNTHITGTTPSFRVYAKDNWVDNNKNGTNDAVSLTDYKTAKVETTPFAHAFNLSQAMPAKDALAYVIKNVGASKGGVRDAVDNLLIQQLTSYGTQGKILTTEDDNGITGNVGIVANGTPPKDTDKDGMSDAWETTRGLNPNVADDKGDDDKDGYTNIEEYLSCLVGEGDCDAAVPCNTPPAKPVVANVSLCQGVSSSALTATASTGNNLVWYGTSATSGTASEIAPSPSTEIAGTTTYYVSQKSATGNCESARAGIVVTVKSCDCQGIENGTATLDNCGRCIGGTTGKTACTSVGEAETDACAFDGITETKNAGFKGISYLNADNAVGTAIIFNIMSENAGTATLSFRYANGGTIDRPAQISLNGTILPNNLSFPATGKFTDWKSVDLSLTLLKGNNDMKIISYTSEGLPNIDQIGYVSLGISKGSCVITGTTNYEYRTTNFNVYPNPTQNKISWEKEQSWVLLNSFGQELENGKSTEINLFSYPKGIYLLLINGQSVKIIKD